ncbi:hypothetical protein ACULMC_04770, partial [Xanthomonas arboricola pv. corylina]|uniref:hypothetical protein n=1 Tax=Xanthomonas arboricola TaxID=56448 RepID=UPI0040407628
RPISLGVGNWTPNWGATQNRGDVGPALVEKTPCMPHKAFWRNGIRMYGTDEHQQAMAELHSLNDGALADVRLLA